MVHPNVLSLPCVLLGDVLVSVSGTRCLALALRGAYTPSEAQERGWGGEARCTVGRFGLGSLGLGLMA